ncbi:MAG TPA: MmgE/PrpD family protein [Dehalococcoidia bacterium]|nr:MmgE/PrpD family protein [Dehalococcoidia bacterium]
MCADNYDGKAVLEAFTSNVLNTRFEDIDDVTISNEKYLILDMIGCAIGGAVQPDTAAMVKMIEGWGGEKEATILGHGVKAPVHDVAFANCLMGRAFDHGVLVMAGGGHASETTALSALALAESKGVDGKELITALVVGDDIASRISAASMGGPPGSGPMRAFRGRDADIDFGAGFEPWGTFTTMGTTAIASRLLGLNSLQVKNAFGIAVNLISGAGSGLWDGTATFKLSQGSSGRSGILAAKLAQAGWTGLLDPFGPRNSYFGAFARQGVSLPEELTKNIGTKYTVDVLRAKMHPGGGPTQSTTDAAIEFATNHDIQAEDIDEVILRLSPAHAAHFHYMRPYKVGDYPTADALFSYKYSVTNGLVRRSGKNKDYTEEAIRDPQIQNVINNMTLSDLDKPIGFEIEVKLKDGRTITEYYEVHVGRAPGETDPLILSPDVMRGRFMDQIEFSQMVSKENAERIIEMVEKLEEIDNVAKIVELSAKQ